MEESILTEYVRKDLESIGYTTYAEVCLKGGGDIRCDLFARVEDKNAKNFGHTIAIEAKLTFNLKVIQQAYNWTKRAHESYVLIPTTYKDMKARKFAREICRVLGIGVMEVNITTQKYYISVKPTRCNNPKIPTLYEEQKHIIASNSDNKFVTPFKITVANINKYMEHKNSEVLLTVVKNIKHHYKTEMSAANAIKNLISKNIIAGFYITKINGKIVIKKYGF